MNKTDLKITKEIFCDPLIEDLKISPKKLHHLLTEEESSLLIIDVRSFISYNQSHIRNSINSCIPKTILKRKGFSLQLIETGACRKSDSDIFRQRPGKKVILYDQNGQETEVGCSISKIIEALQKENKVHSIMWLEGGFDSFNSLYHDSVLTIRNVTVEPKLEQNKFKLTEISSAPAIIPSHSDALIQITDYLFLSGSEAADNYEELTKNGVKYVINTATELRNSFEEYGITYMRLDLVDNPSQKLCEVKVFQAAFNFIDKARKENAKVLVHCRGGRSRSATIIISYLMKVNNWTLQDAYKYVQSKSPKVSPNLGFIGQLLNFESQLRGGSTDQEVPVPLDPPKFSPNLSEQIFFSSVQLTS